MQGKQGVRRKVWSIYLILVPLALLSNFFLRDTYHHTLQPPPTSLRFRLLPSRKQRYSTLQLLGTTLSVLDKLPVTSVLDCFSHNHRLLSPHSFPYIKRKEEREKERKGHWDIFLWSLSVNALRRSISSTPISSFFSSSAGQGTSHSYHNHHHSPPTKK